MLYEIVIDDFGEDIQVLDFKILSDQDGVAQIAFAG